MQKQSFGESIIEGLTELADALEKNETLDERFTYRRIVLRLDVTSFKPETVRETRGIFKASQAVFAQFLGVSAKTVQAWESGQNSPSDMACRFMDEIRRDPKYWQRRFKAAIVGKAVQPKLAKAK